MSKNNLKFIQPHLGSGMSAPFGSDLSGKGHLALKKTSKPRKHVLSALVNNKPGVLTKIAGLYARRGYNIESLAVSPTENPGKSRMTIVVNAEDELVIRQITAQMDKLIDVITVHDLTDDAVVERELALLKVTADSESRAEIVQITEIFRANIVDVSETSLMISVVGTEDKVDALEENLSRFGIVEVVRTGKVVLRRGAGET